MKKYIIALLLLAATVKADKPFVAFENCEAHSATVRLMAQYGIPYTDKCTGKYNGVNTPDYIFKTSRSVEEYRYRMQIWKYYGNIIYKR